jgi:hypothetical protein
MPTIFVDQAATFTAPPIAISTGPKLKFGTDVQDVNSDGEARWVVQAAVSYTPQYGRQEAEVISVTIVGADPGIAPGTVIEFQGLTAGVSAPEKRDNGRVSGGRLFWSAAAVRPLHGSRHAPSHTETPAA